jgi:hypothetical protein
MLLTMLRIGHPAHCISTRRIFAVTAIFYYSVFYYYALL